MIHFSCFSVIKLLSATIKHFFSNSESLAAKCEMGPDILTADEMRSAKCRIEKQLKLSARSDILEISVRSAKWPGYSAGKMRCEMRNAK